MMLHVPHENDYIYIYASLYVDGLGNSQVKQCSSNEAGETVAGATK